MGFATVLVNSRHSPSIKIGMLTVREPPPSLVVACTMCVWYVAIVIDCWKFHSVLIIQGVARIPAVPSDSQPETHRVIGHPEVIVISRPVLAVNVFHAYLQFCAVVFGQSVQVPVAEPMFARGRAEAVGVVVPTSVEVNGTILTFLDGRPASVTIGHDGLTFSRWDQVDAAGTWYRSAVIGQFVYDVLVLLLEGFQLLDKVNGRLGGV